MGAPEFKPTDEQRRLVLELASFGTKQADIARVVVPGGMSEPTLRKHFREELDTGTVHANHKVAKGLFQQATEGNITAMISWLKTRAQWRETNHHEVDVNGRMQNDSTAVKFDPASLTTEERDALLRVIHKRLQGAS